jgi:Na+-translocating ferredoxin:NAD+ oxidoreductase subunit A
MGEGLGRHEQTPEIGHGRALFPLKAGFVPFLYPYLKCSVCRGFGRKSTISLLFFRQVQAGKMHCFGVLTPKPGSGGAKRRKCEDGTPYAVIRPTSIQSFPTMSEILLLLLSTALVNNVVLIKFLGLCPVMGVSKSVDSAFGMGMATTFVIMLATAASWMLDAWLLTPFGLGYLRILSFILVIASVVQFTEMFIKKSSPGLYQSLGIYLPLITTNCAVLGIALLNVQQQFSLFKSLLYGFGSALGFTLVLLIFAGLRERVALARVPAAFAGAPIAFITISLLALAFMGFSGLNV